jgi:4-amino-4-deoxy-L-arabinose transferase-like glycosyltransferase
MFVVPAALGLAGYPAWQTAYAVNALYQVLSFFLVAHLASAVVTRREAAALGWIVQLLPIAFVFRIRANQEYAVLAALLFAVFSTERARTRPAWIAGMLAGFSAVLLVKGVFAFMVPVACAIWLLARSGETSLSRRWTPWLGIVLMPVAGVLITWMYESAYVHVTGRSFLQVYQSRQLPEDALTSGSLLRRIAYTAVWYAGRVIWYAFPWSLLAIGVAVTLFRRGYWRPWIRRAADRLPAMWQGAWFAVVAACALTAAFSVAHRKADRYIFPVYFLVGAAGGVAAMHRSSRMQRVVTSLDRPWVGAAFYVALFLLSLVARGKLPEITFWRS